jgi:crotonobetainyl-CoA:carnitine CoA-transferase CaiB-like acyl-CoA transferase
MVTPTPDLEAQLLWLAQEDAHEDLFDEKYADPDNLIETLRRIMQVLRNWVATRDPDALFFEAQSRHMPYGRVLPIEQVADNPQLKEHPIASVKLRGQWGPMASVAPIPMRYSLI